MLEYRDEETNELVTMLVDKARKVKVTPLKKAILLKRQRVLQDRVQRKEEKLILKLAANKIEEEDDGFVTIDDEDGLVDESKS